MSRPSSTLALFPILLAVACGGDTPLGPDSLSVEFAGESFRRPVEIRGTLVNHSDTPLYTNTCSVRPERRVDAQWVPEAGGDLRVCTASFEILRPGKSLPFSITLTDGLPPGTYRLRFPGYHGPGTEGAIVVVSRSFALE